MTDEERKQLDEELIERELEGLAQLVKDLVGPLSKAKPVFPK
jgi:hypothetical protein